MGTGASQAQDTAPLINRQCVSRSVYCQTDPEQLVIATDAAVVGAAPIKDEATRIEDIWLDVKNTLDVPMGEHNNKDLVVKRRGWKTIRVFVSSTFKDLQNEREMLVKEVFPDLRTWCEVRRLHLVECDLRWGIPKDTTTEMTLRTCLGEIDRCYQDNIMPFFLNMTSERIGWIPEEGEVPKTLVDEYRWVFGLSITEMEIVHGAYRKDNPNSLFLIRNDSFLDEMPQNERLQFVDENKIAPNKLQTLRKMIRDRFPPERVVEYSCKNKGSKNDMKLEVDGIFYDTVFHFFKQRINEQYPLQEEEEDVLVRAQEAHESFMKSRAFSVLGRKDLITQVADYINGSGQDTPLLILGGAGTGKSSLMAKAVDETVARAHEIPRGGKHGWHVFYHFVGAVPGSTDLRAALGRLLREIKLVDDSNMPTDLDAAVQVSCSALNNPSTRPVIIFIDALNQFDADRQAELMTWVPKKLAPNVRCVFSMISDTPPHKNLMDRESKPQEMLLKPLDLAIRKDMVVEFLGKFNKRLDMDQMFSLLSKKSSENPLWLSIACEELRVYGEFRKLHDKINSMSDGLLELLQQVLARFEQEGGGTLLVSTLCLLEVSATGLLESELLEILADEENLMPPEKAPEKGSKESSGKDTFKPCGNLPAFKWASIYRSLRPFLRPFGDSGEGRLDFYHRSLSKAVRKKYLKVIDKETVWNDQYEWWHRKLANFFDHSDNWDRKVEEYPVHLVKLKDSKRLAEFLEQWPVFERMYDREFSQKLFRFWKECGGNPVMKEVYSLKLKYLEENSSTTDEEMNLRLTQVGKILNQAGLYDEALELAERALKMEEEKMGKRPTAMLDLYTLIASIWDMKTKLHEFCDKTQIPEQREVIRLNLLAIDLLMTSEELKTRPYRLWLGRQQMRLAFAFAGLSDCGGDEDYPVAKCIEEGFNSVNLAIDIFTDMHDMGYKAEALMTKATLCRNDFRGQIKLYTEALELSKQAHGHYHILTGRIYMNTGICYEDQRMYEKAYECFHTNYTINQDVYGPDHLRSQRSRNVLMEPFYAHFAQQRGVYFLDQPQNAETGDNARDPGPDSDDDI